jgi:hypothetical protein
VLRVEGRLLALGARGESQTLLERSAEGLGFIARRLVRLFMLFCLPRAFLKGQAEGLLVVAVGVRAMAGRPRAARASSILLLALPAGGGLKRGEGCGVSPFLSLQRWA